mgnify:CR=1 FL=1
MNNMITILIVDDEIYAVDAIKEMIDWNALGIDTVLTAYSMQQAQKLMTETRVDILLCDIEMPKGSGLELVSWAREQDQDAVVIFLTSHANFNYANQAIKLDTFDYLLKPADPEELQKILKQAVDKVNETFNRISQLEVANFWFDSFVQLCENFILRVADGRISPDRETILHEAKRLHLYRMEFGEQFYIALIQLRAETDDEKEWGKGLTEYGLKNILSEVFYTDENNNMKRGMPLIPRLTDRHYLLCMNSKMTDWNEFVSLCQQAVSDSMQVIPSALTIYPHQPVPIEQFSAAGEALLKIAADNVLYDNIVYFQPDPQTRQEIEKEWQKALVEAPDAENLGELLDRMARAGTLTRTALRRMYELVCNYVKDTFPQEIRPAELETGIVCATSSLDGMKEWINGVFSKLPHSEIQDKNEPKDVINVIRKYIREHIGEELGRSELAALVYLNPDYLSHIFREKAGVSLVDFITAERMKKARELLRTTSIPIRDVALAVGYSNISYFSRQFKRSQGMTPLEFRRKDGDGTVE